jgi:hypothetical protein
MCEDFCDASKAAPMIILLHYIITAIVLLSITIDVPLTVKHIFEDNLNGAGFRLAEKDNLRDVEITKVNKRAPKCPNCGRKMRLVLYEKGPPTENEVFGYKLADWNHPMLSLSYKQLICTRRVLSRFSDIYL